MTEYYIILMIFKYDDYFFGLSCYRFFMLSYDWILY